MTSTRSKAVVAAVVGLAFAQVLFEDVVVFLGATGTLPVGASMRPFVLVTVPLVIALLLLTILVGGALLDAERRR